MTLNLTLIGIVTRDMAASLAFYRALGVPIDDGNDEAPHVEATLPNGMLIGWDTVGTIQDFDSHYTAPSGGHHIALAFDMGSPAAVDAAVADMEAAGYPAHVEPWDSKWGQRYATLRDPDGNAIELYAELAAS